MMSYLSQVFSASNCASFARWATTATVATGCWALIHLVRVNHALPDAVALTALAGWMTAPYGINKLAAALRPTVPQEPAS